MTSVRYPRPGKETQQYFAKVYRAKPVARQIEEDVEIMIYALLNHATHELEISRIDPPRVNPESKYAPAHQWAVKCGSFFASGRSRGEALCRFLGVILDGCWMPKT